MTPSYADRLAYYMKQYGNAPTTQSELQAQDVAYAAQPQSSPITNLATKALLTKALAGSGSSALPATAAVNAAFNAPALEAANAVYGGNALAGAGLQSSALPAVQSMGTVAATPTAYGGMFAGQGLAGMSNLGMAGTALGIAAPLILGPMIKKAFFKSKPSRAFNLEEILKKNSFGNQIGGFSKYDPKQQSDYINKAHNAGFEIALPGYANKEGATQKNAGAFFKDLTRALSANDRMLRAGRDTDSTFGGSRFARVQDTSIDDVLSKLKSSPVANSGYIDRVQKIKDFTDNFNKPPAPKKEVKKK